MGQRACQIALQSWNACHVYRDTPGHTPAHREQGKSATSGNLFYRFTFLCLGSVPKVSHRDLVIQFMLGRNIVVQVFGRRDFIALTGAATLGATGAALAHPFDFPDRFLPQLVNSGRTDWLAGEIHVTPDNFFLYFMLNDGMAIRYGVGIGRKKLYTPGEFTVNRKAEWPWWRPTNAMIRREPEKYAKYSDGVPGGPSNPLGARALYLYNDDGHDTYLRIHGTNAPSTIGREVSNGCARLTNEHIKDLYPRVELGARVFLYPKSATA